MSLTQNEVGRVSHHYIYDTEGNDLSTGFGVKHGINAVCRYCKSDETEELTKNHEDYNSFKNFFQTFEYKAYECCVCGARFAWYKPYVRVCPYGQI